MRRDASSSFRLLDVTLVFAAEGRPGRFAQYTYGIYGLGVARARGRRRTAGTRRSAAETRVNSQLPTPNSQLGRAPTLFRTNSTRMLSSGVFWKLGVWELGVEDRSPQSPDQPAAADVIGHREREHDHQPEEPRGDDDP